MVDRRVFCVKNLASFHALLAITLQHICLFSSQNAVQANDINIQFCWNGTEEELSNWRNMSCASGESTLGNSLSNKILPSGEESHINTRSVTGYYCMAFKYFDSSQSHDGGEDTTVQTYRAIYTCDTENICEGRNMMEGYKYTYKGHDGTLYCCSTGNNCNKHGIIQSQTHHHTCYNGEVDFTQNPHNSVAEVEDCHYDSRLCIRLHVTGHHQNGSARVVRETFKCDTGHLCEDLNLTEAHHQACMLRENPDLPSNQREEVCCCKGDRCFVPSWLKEPSTKTVKTNPMQAQATWQRTLLIILGVALGILVVGVTLFFVRRSIASTKTNESPTRNTRLAYKSVSSNNDDAMFDDNVQILSSYK